MTNVHKLLAYFNKLTGIRILQPLDTASSRMQTSEFGKSKGLWQTLSEGTWSEAFDGLAISILLTTNPSIQVSIYRFEYLYEWFDET